MIAYDLKLDDTGDLAIENNDFVIAPSDNRHIRDILMSKPGDYKQYPLVGFNPLRRLNSKVDAVTNNRDATTQLVADGYVKGPGGINVFINPNGVLEIKALDVTRP